MINIMEYQFVFDRNLHLYLVWQTHNSQEFTSIPKSCCVKKFGEVDEGCHWEDLFEVYENIFKA